MEYHFISQEDEDKPGSWQGGLEKFWCDEDENWYGEFFVFGEYASEAEFDADVDRIFREAKEVVVKENIDEFLAVTDIVKQRAVQNGLEDNTIEDLATASGWAGGCLYSDRLGRQPTLASPCRV